MPPSSSPDILDDIADFPNPATAASAKGTTIALAALTVGTMFNPVFGSAAGLAGRILNKPAPYFHLRKLRSGGKHAVILVNGFLSEGEHDTKDWERAIKRKFGRATWYHLDWEASRHPRKYLGDMLTLDNLLSVPGRLGSSSPLTVWHGTMRSAEQAGKLLAEAILRTPGWRFTLAGHSLGARVIHFALKALSAHPRKRIENVYLLGAAVGGGAKDDACWGQAIDACKGKIFNCYSRKDSILSLAYRGANLMLSDPAGYSGINFQHDRLFHFDCWQLVHSHMAWKDKFSNILEQLEEYR